MMGDKLELINRLNSVIFYHFMKKERIKFSNSFISINLVKGIHESLAIEVIEVSNQ
jgi:hypothetical protein